MTGLDDNLRRIRYAAARFSRERYNESLERAKAAMAKFEALRNESIERAKESRAKLEAIRADHLARGTAARQAAQARPGFIADDQDHEEFLRDVMRYVQRGGPELDPISGKPTTTLFRPGDPGAAGLVEEEAKRRLAQIDPGDPRPKRMVGKALNDEWQSVKARAVEAARSSPAESSPPQAESPEVAPQPPAAQEPPRRRKKRVAVAPKASEPPPSPAPAEPASKGRSPSYSSVEHKFNVGVRRLAELAGIEGAKTLTSRKLKSVVASAIRNRPDRIRQAFQALDESEVENVRQAIASLEGGELHDFRKSIERKALPGGKLTPQSLAFLTRVVDRSIAPRGKKGRSLTEGRTGEFVPGGEGLSTAEKLTESRPEDLVNAEWRGKVSEHHNPDVPLTIPQEGLRFRPRRLPPQGEPQAPPDPPLRITKQQAKELDREREILERQARSGRSLTPEQRARLRLTDWRSRGVIGSPTDDIRGDIGRLESARRMDVGPPGDASSRLGTGDIDESYDALQQLRRLRRKGSLPSAVVKGNAPEQKGRDELPDHMMPVRALKNDPDRVAPFEESGIADEIASLAREGYKAHEIAELLDDGTGRLGNNPTEVIGAVIRRDRIPTVKGSQLRPAKLGNLKAIPGREEPQRVVASGEFSGPDLTRPGTPDGGPDGPKMLPPPPGRGQARDADVSPVSVQGTPAAIPRDRKRLRPRDYLAPEELGPRRNPPEYRRLVTEVLGTDDPVTDRVNQARPATGDPTRRPGRFARYASDKKSPTPLRKSGERRGFPVARPGQLPPRRIHSLMDPEKAAAATKRSITEGKVDKAINDDLDSVYESIGSRPSGVEALRAMSRDKVERDANLVRRKVAELKRLGVYPDPITRGDDDAEMDQDAMHEESSKKRRSLYPLPTNSRGEHAGHALLADAIFSEGNREQIGPPPDTVLNDKGKPISGWEDVPLPDMGPILLGEKKIKGDDIPAPIDPKTGQPRQRRIPAPKDPGRVASGAAKAGAIDRMFGSGARDDEALAGAYRNVDEIPTPSRGGTSFLGRSTGRDGMLKRLNPPRGDFKSDPDKKRKRPTSASDTISEVERAAREDASDGVFRLTAAEARFPRKPKGVAPTPEVEETLRRIDDESR